MIYGSVCSGIEAASAAWGPLGWEAAWFAETAKFSSAVLAHHYPGVENRGDFTEIDGEAGPIDVLVGGTPCQSYSVAGKRAGLDDARGLLAFEFLKLAGRLRPEWIVFENVPGILSSDGGRVWAAWLRTVEECGYGGFGRVLDAQYFGVAQRRRRVFFIGYLGDWRPAAAVLFERESLCWHPPPRRKAGAGVAGTLAGGPGTRGFNIGAEGAAGGYLQAVTPETYSIQERAVSENLNNGPGGKGYREGVAYTLEARNKVQAVAYGGNNTGGPLEVSTAPRAKGCTGHGDVAHTLRGEGHDASEDGTGRGTPIVVTPLTGKPYAGNEAQESRLVAHTLRDQHNPACDGEGIVPAGMAVRRLTPLECERLQGFPDDYTRIPWRGKAPEDCPDSPRYRALGESMAVPVMRWIGERIAAVNHIVEANGLAERSG